ncbi:MAG: sensor histidine kinase [Bacteroidota bacterium]
MRLELRGKVLILALATAFAAVILASLILNSLLARGFAGYLRTAEEDRAEAAVAGLADYYRRHGTWLGLQESFLPGMLVAVSDAGGNLVLIRPSPRRGMMRGFVRGLERRPIEVDGATVGYAYFHFTPLTWSSGAEHELRAGMNRAFLIAGISAAALAVLLGLYFARRLTDPIRRIEDAARAMAGGDLDRRADVDGDDELARLAGTLNSLAARTKGLLEERRRLAMDLAHELRTPLAVIKSLTEAFADGVLPADAGHLAQVGEEIARLEGLAERIPAAFLAEEHTASPRAEVVLNGLVADLVHRFSLRFREKDVRLVWEIPGEEAAVLGNREALLTALGNLLDNALKYSPAGAQVDLTMRVEDGWASIEVADQGPGISAAHLPRIFDRLYRADPSRSRTTGGFGLGLAIARAVAESHAGTLTASSEPGRGAVFTLRLPLRGGRP